MKKNDILTILGLVIGIGLIVWAIVTGGSYAAFISPQSFAITVGGSFAAILITYPMPQIKNMFKVIGQTFKENSMSNTDIINNFTNLSRKARREGLLSLEDEINNIEDEFIKKGLQMVVDGIEPDVIKNILELEINEMDRRHEDSSNLLQTWGAYAPAFGMVGTLVGLIQMLANLSDASNLASGMSTALVTTFYGSILANLILIPLATNLKYKSGQDTIT
ncbi:chemotaxis protein PomA [Clostridium tepidiprofundi DSM 19306]|uniref:Chemotaxis protein PomA n=1 Tax=Clostridium tepidiprofundi DSM 19306 TaxID=1121338 RepID=A0A151B579_9CLOT|nr:motility protein A [Clostridium tepidiprofundi]KYH35071.1 chemotaxis protein PomA [Clostridium tepidiprofundi DSM 19306]